ncbi:MAG: M64 family metallopeptidase [Thermoanaerobaculia bacterium]
MKDRTIPRTGAALATALLLATSPAAPGPAPAATLLDAFTPQTMRVDLLHTGGKGTEIVVVDRVVNDGPWAGSLTKADDGLGLGPYRFEVLEPATGRLLYARGYSSIYAEWETTPEAKAAHGTFRESLRFPWPLAKVQVVLKKRDRQNLFREVFTTLVDPASAEVNPAPPPKTGSVWTVFESGPPNEKVDLLVLGEGYAEKDLPKFHADVKRMVETLFRYEPFQSRRADFNVRALDLPSGEGGAHRPQSKIFRRTPLQVQYNIFGSERYVLTYDDRALRDAAAQAPHDVLEILVNDAQYGGGGIYNHQATASADTAFAEYVFVHEFGHHFAALADEYYTSDVAYETGAADLPEPWEMNVTALRDPAKLKWRDLVEAGTPLPTPWSKEAFEKASRDFQARRKALLAAGRPPAEIDALFREQQKVEAAFFAKEKWAGKVGAYEGAAYEAKGLYRSSADCIMFTRTTGGFCPVCRKALEKVIDSYARP